MKKQPLQVSYDEQSDIIIIDGIKYTGDVFRDLSVLTKPDCWLRIEQVGDGVITAFTYQTQEICDGQIKKLEYEKAKQLTGDLVKYEKAKQVLKKEIQK